MAAAFTEKESRLVKAALESVQGGDSALMKLINFEEVYGQCDYKNAANAKEMFRRLMIKLKGGNHRAPKTSDAAPKPQGVSKVKAKKGDGVFKPGRRGRQKKNVVEESGFVDDADGIEEQFKDANKDSDSDATVKDEKSEDFDEKAIVKEEEI